MGKEFLRPEYIPMFSELLHDPNLQKIDCLVFGAVYWYERLKEGKCFASNQSLAEVVGAKNSNSVSNSLKVLEDNGYIKCEYSDESKRRRMHIECLIHRLNRSHPGMKRVPSTDEQNRIINKRTNNTSENKFSQDGAEVIKAFESINPTCKKFYSNKTQRQAADDLIQNHGKSQVLSVVGILPKTNKMAYLPTITTPLQLHDKWAQLEAGLIKLKGKTESVKPKVAFR